MLLSSLCDIAVCELIHDIPPAQAVSFAVSQGDYADVSRTLSNEEKVDILDADVEVEKESEITVANARYSLTPTRQVDSDQF